MDLKVIPQMTDKPVSPKGFLNREDLKSIGWNILKFAAPALGVFFAQLQLGVALKPALLVAALTLYGILADYLNKLNSSSK